MNVGSVYRDVSARLDEYLESLGMMVPRGPTFAMGELVRGILWTGSVQLSNAARVRAGSSSELAQIVQRLSGHLASRKWDHEPWAAAILARQVHDLQEEDLIPIDGTELAKPYARCLEHQGIVQDSTSPDDPLVPGFWVWGAYVWNPQRQSLRPLMLRPYSQAHPDFDSENRCWDRFAWVLRKATGGNGIWLHDRGGDRPEVFASWLRLQARWVIRLRKDRPLIGPDGTRRPAEHWAQQALTQRPERGRAVTLPVHLPPDQVKQLGPHPVPLWLVVPTSTFGDDERWLLLTRGLIDPRAGPRQVRHDYALRWRSEDAKRFLGQIWRLERFLTRSFLALERMLWCVVAAGGFLALLEQEEPQLTQELAQETVYWDKDEVIHEYRMARGLMAVAAQNGIVAVANNAG